MMYTFIPAEEDLESTNSEIEREIIILRKRVIAAEQERIHGIETMSIYEAKEQLQNRFE